MIKVMNINVVSLIFKQRLKSTVTNRTPMIFKTPLIVWHIRELSELWVNLKLWSIKIYLPTVCSKDQLTLSWSHPSKHAPQTNPIHKSAQKLWRWEEEGSLWVLGGALKNHWLNLVSVILIFNTFPSKTPHWKSVLLNPSPALEPKPKVPGLKSKDWSKLIQHIQIAHKNLDLKWILPSGSN